MNLFQPGADTAYPLLSTSALALAAWGSKWSTPERPFRAGPSLAVLSGMVMAFGMAFTLAFLPVGLIVALVIVSASSVSPFRKAGLILATGAGFLALTAVGWGVTGANPVIDLELEPASSRAVLRRIPTDLPRLAGGQPDRAGDRARAAVGRLVRRSDSRARDPSRGPPGSPWPSSCLMNLIGRNMGEVARLWMLFLPPLLTAAGPGLIRVGGGPVALAVTAGLLGLQTLALQTLIQVVYPV